MKKTITPLKKQSGVVLVVSMIMLLLLTLIGVSGSQVTGQEEIMAGNARDQNVAFQAAESTLLEAETFILTNSTASSTYSGAGGLLDEDDNEPGFFDSATWTDANSASTSNGFGGNFVNNAGTAIADPRYIIKKIGTIPLTSPVETAFRITARAQGISPGTQIVLQEIFVRTD